MMYTYTMDPVAKIVYETYVKPNGFNWRSLARHLGKKERVFEVSANKGRTVRYWLKLCERMGWDPAPILDFVDGERWKVGNEVVLQRLCDADVLYAMHFFDELRKRNRLTMKILQVALECGLISERDAAALGILPPPTSS